MVLVLDLQAAGERSRSVDQPDARVGHRWHLLVRLHPDARVVRTLQSDTIKTEIKLKIK